eukprot:1139151-Pelagomonas_calceolata.AAC.7
MPFWYCLARLGSSFSNRPPGILLLSSAARDRQCERTRASRSSSSTCTQMGMYLSIHTGPITYQNKQRLKGQGPCAAAPPPAHTHACTHAR